MSGQRKFCTAKHQKVFLPFHSSSITMKSNDVVEENKIWGTFCPKRLKNLSIFIQEIKTLFYFS